MRELPNLDLLRSFAVLLVVASHLLLYTGQSSVFGYSFWFIGVLGVIVFFTHTTLVLMWSLERDPHPLRFYIRRIFRIYPLWLTVLFLSVAVHLPTTPRYAPAFRFFHPSLGELLLNATLTFNLSKVGCRLIGASWSLPVEVQMYIVLPFLFFFMRAYRKIWPLLLLAALAAAMSYHEGSGAISTTPLFCTPFFLPGAIAYLIYKRRHPRFPAWTFIAWIFFLTAIFNAWGSHWQNSFRSGWVFALLMGLTLPLFQQLKFKSLNRATHLIARYSYGVYLGHCAAIAVGVHYLEGQSLALRTLGFLATIVVLPVVFYHLVEKPMIKLGSRLAQHVEEGKEPSVNERLLSLEPAP